MKPNSTLAKILAGTALLAFTVGIGFACLYSEANTLDKIPGWLNYSLTGVAALLTANVGAVLGIPALGIGLKSELMSHLKLTNKWKAAVIACYSYLGVLFLVFLFWVIIENGTEDQTQIVNIIPNLGKTFIAFCVGALGYVLKEGINVVLLKFRALKQSPSKA